MTKLATSTVNRLIILKYELSKAAQFLHGNLDDYQFALGLSLLHDSLENFFWIIENTHGVGFKERASFTDKFDQIKAKLKVKILINRTNIDELNSIRNSYKHHGVLPNIHHAQPIAEQIIQALSDTVWLLYRLKYDNISLSILIKNKILYDRINKVERKITSHMKKNYSLWKDSIIDIGQIFYDFNDIHQHTGLSSIFDELEYHKTGKIPPRYKLPKVQLDYRNIELLELGIVPYSYYRFKNIVPEFAYDIKEKKGVPIYPSSWSKENWTELNTKYCLDWIINYFLKKESLSSVGNYKIEHNTSDVQILTAKRDYQTNLRSKDLSKVISVGFRKGESYLGKLLDYTENGWRDYNNSRVSTYLVLYVQKNLNGDVPKDLFDIKETFFDEINEKNLNKLLDNNGKAIKSA